MALVVCLGGAPVDDEASVGEGAMDVVRAELATVLDVFSSFTIDILEILPHGQA